eukprot:7786613-Pyramimonas_sp.AAC.1
MLERYVLLIAGINGTERNGIRVRPVRGTHCHVPPNRARLLADVDAMLIACRAQCDPLPYVPNGP